MLRRVRAVQGVSLHETDEIIIYYTFTFFFSFLNGHARRNEKWATFDKRCNDRHIIWTASYFSKNECFLLVPHLILHWLSYVIVCTSLFFLWYRWFFICFLKYDTNQISNLLLNFHLLFFPTPQTLPTFYLLFNYWISLGYSMIYG